MGTAFWALVPALILVVIFYTRRKARRSASSIPPGDEPEHATDPSHHPIDYEIAPAAPPRWLPGSSSISLSMIPFGGSPSGNASGSTPTGSNPTSDEERTLLLNRGTPVEQPTADLAPPPIDKTLVDMPVVALSKTEPESPGSISDSISDSIVAHFGAPPGPTDKAPAQSMPAPKTTVPAPRASVPAPRASVPAPRPSAPPPAQVDQLPDFFVGDDEDDDDESSSRDGLAVEFDEELDEDGPSPGIRLRAFAWTDPGAIRGTSEDSHLVFEDQHVYAVADGMSGKIGGRCANEIAIEAISRSLEQKGARRVTPYRRANQLLAAIEAANRSIRGAARASRERHETGTTVAAASFSLGKRRVYVANVGDSRVYRVRAQQITQLTKDHTFATELGLRNFEGPLLSRAVGISRRVKIDLRTESLTPGDRYVLCTDGLTTMVPDPEILRIVRDNDLEPAAKRLVQAANDAGGLDNITVIVVGID